MTLRRIARGLACAAVFGGLSMGVGGCGGSGVLAVKAQPFWPGFRGGPLNQGRAAETGPAGAIDWTFAGSVPIFAAAAVAGDGTVFMGVSDGKVYALDGVTGATKWTFTTGDAIDGEGISIGADGTVYAGSTDHSLYALDPKTGEKKWAFATGGVILDAANFGPDGTVYCGSWFTEFVGDALTGPYEGKVYAIDPGTGKEKWEFKTGGAVGATPAIDAGGTVYVGSYDENLYALNGKTGAVKWKYTTDAPIISSAALSLDGKSVFVGSYDQSVYCLNTATGALRWKHTTGGPIVSSPAVGTNGLVYIGSWDGSLYALDAATGATRWTIDVSQGGASSGDPSPVLGSDGTVYYEANDTGQLFAANGDTGVKKWQLTLDPLQFDSGALGADGRLYIGSLSGKLYCIK